MDLVVGEGASCLILEEYRTCQSRGAKIYAEIIGYGSNTDGQHVTRPDSEMMGRCMPFGSVKMRKSAAEQIDYVNAHGTSTDQGDIAETQATARVLGYKPISSLKSYLVIPWVHVEQLKPGSVLK